MPPLPSPAGASPVAIFVTLPEAEAWFEALLSEPPEANHPLNEVAEEADLGAAGVGR